MIPYGHQSIDREDIKAVEAVLRSDRLTQGPNVERFELALAASVGAGHAVAFANGTLALQASYFAMGLGRGDEFITSPITFAATANAGLWFGGKPVFVDIDPETGNMDPDKIEALVTPRTRAIVPVDYAGYPADIERIRSIAKEQKLVVIEDGCHALGASINGKKVGSSADFTIFSFHPVKPITTGEGGAVVTDDPSYDRRLRLFRNHGNERECLERPSEGPWYYEMQELGLNARMTDMQSALGLSQLRKLDHFIEDRARIARFYAERLGDIEALRLPREGHGIRAGWHLYPVLLQGAWAKRRREAFERLRAAGIGVQVHFIPVYRHPYYERLGYRRGLCPKAEAFYESEISLPIFPGLSGAEMETVVQAVRGILLE
jgi:perosamine synthetase